MTTFSFPLVSDLTLGEKIGQMLCLGWSGDGAYLAVNEQARECVVDLMAGSMIVMGRNVLAPGANTLDIRGVRAMLTELQGLAPRLPLLIATDQEGGRVARFGTPPFTLLPTAEAIGRTGDPALAQAAARATAMELAAVGVNWNFAPDADVNSNPLNPVIGDRSFGTAPAMVARMAAAQVRGYAEGGVLSSAKHFPGHGDTHLDSHLALPTVEASLSELEERELIPFQAVIAAEAPTLMTAHIQFPKLDASGVPATLSHAILTDLLRVHMGFTGLLVTDCLQMKAVADRWGTARAAVLAAKAGADVLLVCHTRERQHETRDALLAAVQSGELPLARVEEAAGRVLAAKRLAFARPQPPLSVIGAVEHRRIAEAIRAASGAATISGPTTLGESAPI
ncbi:MAG: glycoside hydrolase [Cytophagales bacterium]|nr:glycoside hydrolase [Armatimonadota bacterium]